MAAPTATQTASDTIHAVRCYAVFTPTGEGATAVELLTNLVDYNGDLQTIFNLAVSTDNVLRPNRESVKSSQEEFTVEVVEIEKGHDVLGGFNKLKKGSVILYLFDPDDAAGKVKLKSGSFACSVKRDGNVEFGSENFAKMKLKFVNLSGSDVSWSFDAATT